MRTIKFRGKDVMTGEWVYGYFVILHSAITDGHGTVIGHKEEPSIFNDEPGQRSVGCYWHTINPETVGQFTGLYDKNGKHIYDGDIIKAGDEKTLIEVRFVRGVFAFLWNGDLDDEFPCNSPTWEWAEVIGNIHDNPELVNNH